MIKRSCQTDVEAAISGEIGVFKPISNAGFWNCPNLHPNSYTPILIWLANSLPVRMMFKNKSLQSNEQIECFSTFRTRHSGRNTLYVVPGASIHHHHKDRVTRNIVFTAFLPLLLHFFSFPVWTTDYSLLGFDFFFGICRLLFNAKLFSEDSAFGSPCTAQTPIR